MAGKRPVMLLVGGWLSPPLCKALVLLPFRQKGQWLAAAWGSKPGLWLWLCTSWGTCLGLGWARTEQPAMMLQPSLLGPLSALSCVSLSWCLPEPVGFRLPFLQKSSATQNLIVLERKQGPSWLQK